MTNNNIMATINTSLELFIFESIFSGQTEFDNILNQVC